MLWFLLLILNSFWYHHLSHSVIIAQFKKKRGKREEWVFCGLCPWGGPGLVRELDKNTFIVRRCEHSGRSRDGGLWHWRSSDNLRLSGGSLSKLTDKTPDLSLNKCLCQQKKRGEGQAGGTASPSGWKSERYWPVEWKMRTSLYMKSRSMGEVTDKSREVQFSFTKVFIVLCFHFDSFCLTLNILPCTTPSPSIS